MAVLAVLFAIVCVLEAVHGGCQAGPGKVLVTFDDEYKEELKAPIKKVVRDIATDRVECLEALITFDDLGTGTPPNPKTQAYTKKMGYPGDQAGHIVANILGGTGYRTYNIMPQSRKSNTSPGWRTDVERAVRDKVRDGNGKITASFIVEPQYGDPQRLTRPNTINYSYTFSDGTGKSGTVDNPKP